MLPAPSQRLFIYGAGGFGRELHQLIDDVAAAGAALVCIGFLVDRGFRQSAVVHDLPVFDDLDQLEDTPNAMVAIGIGATAPRRRIVEQIEGRFGPRFLNLQHPRAWVGGRVSIGSGTIVCAGALVTSDVSIGRHVQLHVGCNVGHDTIIGDFVTITPGVNVAGHVRIGEGTFVGTGATILPDVEIGRGAMIGAGAVVTKNVPDGVTVVGVPARIVGPRPSP